MPHVCFSPDEMKRRRDFYAAHPSADGKSFSLPTLIDGALPPVLYSFLFNSQALCCRGGILRSKFSMIKVCCFGGSVDLIVISPWGFFSFPPHRELPFFLI